MIQVEAVTEKHDILNTLNGTKTIFWQRPDWTRTTSLAMFKDCIWTGVLDCKVDLYRPRKVVMYPPNDEICEYEGLLICRNHDSGYQNVGYRIKLGPDKTKCSQRKHVLCSKSSLPFTANKIFKHWNSKESEATVDVHLLVGMLIVR